ncbi:hypothetical protein GCM10027614_45150 [Micromonospora vulcania]
MTPEPAGSRSEVPAVEVVGLHVSLDGTPILTGVDLAVAVGEWVTVIGPNGAGKSTLLRAVGGLLRASGVISSSVRRVPRCAAASGRGWWPRSRSPRWCRPA